MYEPGRLEPNAAPLAGEQAGRRVHRRRQALIVLVVLLILSAGAAAFVGAVRIPPGEVALAIIKRLPGIRDLLPAAAVTAHTANEAILVQIRLPRVILAALVGAALATAGATFQALFRNPMADPYVIGASSGAALGASLAMVLSVGLRWFGLGPVPLLAFIGAMAAVTIVYYLARTGNAVPVMTLLLAGIGISSFLSAIVSLLIYFAGERLHQVIFWLMGGFDGANWTYVGVTIPYLIAGGLLVFFQARELNVLLLGEEAAHYLGVRVELAKKLLLMGASLLTAAAVSTSGLIGFVGLIVPHGVRLFTGPDHHILLPAAALAGAIVMVLADTLARIVIAPTELPVGLITALLGGPFFVFLLRRHKQLPFFSRQGG